MSKINYDAEDILRIMPYGNEFCFLSGVTFIGENLSRQLVVKGYYIVNLKQFVGHFKNIAIMPGVLKTEAIAQLGVFWLRSQEKFANYIPMYDGSFTGFSGCMVFPGDRLDLGLWVVEFDNRRKGRIRGKAFKNGKLAQELELGFKIVKDDVLKRKIS
jgi:3-hydroxyacyl-[acyl-carrier-protein] dehydratase